MSKRIGVILSGCGVYDGSEIHESVIAILALNRAGAEIMMMAPDRNQVHVINHLTGEVAEGETRNVLVESARIARGNILDIAAVQADELDAIVMPGGFGAAKNLCDFAFKGSECELDIDVSRLIQDMHRAGKPIVAMCIAPAVATKALTAIGVKPTITIGNDAETAAELEKMGGHHHVQGVEGVEIDSENRLISTPAYMIGPEIKDVAEGIENTIDQLMKMLV